MEKKAELASCNHRGQDDSAAGPASNRQASGLHFGRDQGQPCHLRLSTAIRDQADRAGSQKARIDEISQAEPTNWAPLLCECPPLVPCRTPALKQWKQSFAPAPTSGT